MRNERKVLALISVISLVSALFLCRRRFKLECVIAFLVTGYGNAVIAPFVAKNRIAFPVRILPKVYRSNVLYDYLISPLFSFLLCLLTRNVRAGQVVLWSLVLALVQTAVEMWALKTKLITYKNWSLTATALTVFSEMVLVRYFTRYLWSRRNAYGAADDLS